MSIENLKALVYGFDLNVYQKALAKNEFENWVKNNPKKELSPFVWVNPGDKKSIHINSALLLMRKMSDAQFIQAMKVMLSDNPEGAAIEGELRIILTK